MSNKQFTQTPDERILRALRLIEHKADQAIQGQGVTQRLGLILWAARDALRTFEQQRAEAAAATVSAAWDIHGEDQTHG